MADKYVTFMQNSDFIVLGNGSLDRGYTNSRAIAIRLWHARQKHPASEWSGKGKMWALGVLEEEQKEVTNAAMNETDDRLEDELIDVIAVALRMLNREYD